MSMLKCLTVPLGVVVAGALGAVAVLEPVPGGPAQQERSRARAEERERERAQERSQDREREAAPHRMHEILEGLEQGMVALEKLGRREELRMLRAVAEEVRNGMRGPQPGNTLAHEIEVFELALPALREAGREDTAELVERAIARRRLAIEGARGPDAEEAIRRAPSRPQEIEMLRHAARLWEEFGHERKARAVAELAERLNVEARAEPQRDRPGPGDERREAQRQEHVRRLEHLQEQVMRLERAVEALHEELRTLRHER